jgi:hypothetical protein
MTEKGYTLTPYDKARAQMTQAEYKAWVEKGIWPERIPYPAKGTPIRLAGVSDNA